MKELLNIKNLHSQVEGNNILNGLNFSVKKGEIHTIMGPNGSGKSSLALSVMGHPKFKILKGSIFFNNKNILKMSPDERSRMGIFLAFQHPYSISGITLIQFLLNAYNAHKKESDPEYRPISIFRFKRLLEEECKHLKMKPEFLDRYLNKGFSGGEKKKSEILQMAILKPKLAILDEIDSGLDVDALKDVSKMINKVKKENPDMAVVIITHYNRILRYIKSDRVHVIYKGEIVKSGSGKFADELEKKGFEWIIK